MMRWYVVQVYAGYEDAARQDILKRVQDSDVSASFGQVLVPTSKVKPALGVDVEEEQQLFPGYVLVEMDSSPEAIQLVARCARVLRFLGGETPLPLSQREADRMLSQVRGEVAVAAKIEEKFVVGSEVEILDGPFSGFVGIIDKVNSDSERLAVMVSIFGRMTPVELGFQQVRS